MLTVNSLIKDTFGGDAAFARAIGITTEHAGAMKRRNSIPVRHWPKVIAAPEAAEKGVTYEILVSMHARQPEHGSAA